jgi:hypothetical protein
MTSLAATAQDLSLVAHPDERQFQMDLEKGRISAFGKTYKADERCNEDTIMNSDDLRVFTVNGAKDKIVIWCPGSLDGVSNWITIFRKGKTPITWQVVPQPDKASITLEKLKSEVKSKL